MTETLLKRSGITEYRAADDSKRVLTFVGTDETLDRYRTIIKADGWELGEYRKNPVFLWCHDAFSPPIGKTVDIRLEDVERAAGKKSKRVVFDVQFPPAGVHKFADLVYDLYKSDIMRAVSVGFRNLNKRSLTDEEKAEHGIDPGDDSALVLERNELYELSAVPVPGNPNALKEKFAEVLEARGFGCAVPSESDILLERIEHIRKAIEKQEAVTAWVTGKTDDEKRQGFTCPKPFESHSDCVDQFKDDPDVDDANAFCAAWAEHCGEEQAPALEQVAAPVLSPLMDVIDALRAEVAALRESVHALSVKNNADDLYGNVSRKDEETLREILSVLRNEAAPKIGGGNKR